MYIVCVCCQLFEEKELQFPGDGFDRLDEVSDEEDLDLIPPRNVDARCQCCGILSTEGCVIS